MQKTQAAFKQTVRNRWSGKKRSCLTTINKALMDSLSLGGGTAGMKRGVQTRVSHIDAVGKPVGNEGRAKRKKRDFGLA